MDATTQGLVAVHQLAERSGGLGGDAQARPPVYKVIGLSLAIASGVFIGVSFVLKKMGLLKANEKYNEEAGEGYGYLKNAWWWSGMTLMIVGEICNFVAYAFVDAILVTPLGALSVVVTTILSAIFLKERLSFVGKVGCFNCIIGSVVIVLNAPSQSAVADIEGMKKFVIAPGFLTYTGVVLVACTFIALWVAPRYGKKSMLVYLSICSLIGGLSVVCTQGLGAAVVAQAGGKAQFNNWFLYVVLVFVITTLVIEIIYLNKALNLFNAALVTPTYYVFFTSATIVTSAILFQGFKGTAISITTVIMGFLQICAGVVLLQFSKSAKDVPDSAVFKGDLDQVREISEQEQPESEPKADAIRGTAGIIRRISMSRKKMEEAEAKRYRDEKLQSQLEPLAENEIAEWDGLRRRKTIIGDGAPSPLVRRKTIHPPLGMSHFPTDSETEEQIRAEQGLRPNWFETARTRASSLLRSPGPPGEEASHADGHNRPVALSDIKHTPGNPETPIEPFGPGSFEEAQAHIYGLPPGLRKEQAENSGQDSPRSKPLPAQPTVQSPLGAPNIPMPSPLQGKGGTRRQFSFQNMFRNPRSPHPDNQASFSSLPQAASRPTLAPRNSSAETKKIRRTATEEEQLGLVKGDSHAALFDPDPRSSSDHDSTLSSPPRPLSHEGGNYTYTGHPQDSHDSSPEAHTPLVPKHSYLLSSSTMSDHPMMRDLHSPDYPDSRHPSSAPPPPIEEEADVDDPWQIQTHNREPHPLPSTLRSPPPANTLTSPPPPLFPKPPSQRPNPYHLPPSQPIPLPHSTSFAQRKATTAPPAAESDRSLTTPTLRLRNTTADTTSSASPPRAPIPTPAPSHARSDSSSPTRVRDQDLPPATQQPPPAPDPQPPVGIRVTSPEETEYEARRIRFQERQARLDRWQDDAQPGPSHGQNQRRKDDDTGGGGGESGAFV